MQIVKTIRNIWFADGDVNLFEGGPISDRATSCWWSTAVFTAKFIAGLGVGGAVFGLFPRARWKLGAAGLISLAIFMADNTYQIAFWPKPTQQEQQLRMVTAWNSAIPGLERRRELENEPDLLTFAEYRTYKANLFRLQGATLPRHFFWLPQPALGRVGAAAVGEGIACCWVALCAPAVFARIANGFANPPTFGWWITAGAGGSIVLGMRLVRYYRYPPWAHAKEFSMERTT
jgi:hypothetical protein